MSLADSVYSTTQQPTNNVYINGVLVAALSLRGQDSYDSPVPTVDLELPSIPSWIQRGQSVVINAGYGNDTIRLFTGGVVARGDEDPDFLRTQCFVTGATDATGAQIAATASLIGGPPVWPPIPSGNYIDFSVDNSLIWDLPKAAEAAGRELTRQARVPQRPSGPLLGRVVRCVGDLYGAFRSYQIPAKDFSGKTVKTAIGQVLAASGVSHYDTSGVPSYTLAAAGATLDRMPGSQQLAKLMGIDGCSVQQLRSGTVLVRVIDFQPASTANFTYSTTVEAYARIMDATGELQVPFNPLLQIGMTIQLDIDYLGVSGRYFLQGHRWEIGPDGAWSYLDLRGGPEYGGTVGINPIADFTFVVEQEVIGDRVYQCVTFDASSSQDPDGTIADPAGYVWTDNQGAHKISGTGKVKTVTVDPTAITGDWIVTLTVTDNDGLTGTTSKTVPVAATSNVVQLPAIYVAMGNNHSASPDGGVTWNDEGGTNVISVGARPADGVNFGHACFGRSDGSIWRTLDGCQTAPTQVASGLGSPVNDIQWDWRDATNVWAITENCQVYRSIDGSASFALYADLRAMSYVSGNPTPAALGNKLGCPGGGGIWIFGGSGDGYPLIAYDWQLNGQWTRVGFVGDLATDLPATANIRIADFTAPGDGHSTMILTNATGGGAGLVAIYDSINSGGPIATYTRATGLTGGLTDGHVILSDSALAGTLRYALFNDRDVWTSVDCLAYTKTANVLPSGVTANHGLFLSDLLTGMPEFAGIFLLACQNAGGTLGIYKSTDALQTVGALRPATGFPAWPTGAQAKKIAIGALRTLYDERLAALGLDASPREVSTLLGFGITTWTAPVGITGTTSGDPRLRCLTSQLWFTIPSNNGDSAWGWGCGSRTKDGGASWAATPDPGVGSGGIMDIAADAGGRIWCTIHTTHSIWTVTEVYYSDDQGDHWTLSSTYGNGSSEQMRSWKIIPHPTNQNQIAIIGSSVVGITNRGFILYTLDRGASWGVNEKADIYKGQGSVDEYYDAFMLPNGRIVAAGAFTSVLPISWSIRISDDWGQNWAKAWESINSSGATQGLYRSASGGVVGLIYSVLTGGPYTHRLILSTNGATSFASVSLAVELEAAVGSNSIQPSGRMAFSPANDAIYLDVNVSSTWHIAKLSPVGPGGVWTNLTDAYPHASVGSRNLAVIPA